METIRAQKAVERMAAIWPCEMDIEFRGSMIRRFEEMDESSVNPKFLEFLDMSDLKFKLMVPILKPIVRAGVQENINAFRQYMETITV